MPNRKLQVVNQNPLVRTYPVAREPGSWMTVPSEKMSTRQRMGLHPLHNVAHASSPAAFQAAGRTLTPDQLFKVYLTTPDVRAAIDSIVRRVATWDHDVVPAIDPDDPRMEEAQAAADKANEFLENPTEDGWTWQEWLTAIGIDLLVFDAGVAEKVDNSKGELVELVPFRGSDFFPIMDDHSRVLGYRQWLFGSASFSPSESGTTFEREDLLYIQLFKNTSFPLGLPLIDTLVDQIVAILVASEHVVLALDADEIPPGLLVLGGIADHAVRAAIADLQNRKGQDHRIRVVTAQAGGGISAEWIEFRRDLKSVQLIEVVEEIKRTIWRVFGVFPIEMGSEDATKAHATVQLDVSSSHLITPILEIVQAKINREVIPRIVGEEAAKLIKFKFDRDQKLNAEERLQRAETHKVSIESGVLSINECRADLNKLPIPGGDVHRILVGGLLIPVNLLASSDVVGGFNDSPASFQDNADGDMGADVQDNEDDVPQPVADVPVAASTLQARSPSCRMDGESSADCVSRKIPEILDENPDMSRDQAVAIAISICEKKCESRSVRSSIAELVDDLPSEWQREGLFADFRTLDLSELGSVVAAYTRGIEPKFNELEQDIGAIIRSRYEPNELTEDKARVLRNSVLRSVQKLSDQWQLLALPLYEKAARIGLNTARDIARAPVLDSWEIRTDIFRQEAMSYLDAQNGPIKRITNDLTLLIDAATIGTRAKQPEASSETEVAEDVDSSTSLAVVLGLAILAIRRQAYRLRNWAGRLVELANQTLVDGLKQVDVREDGTPQYFAEWVHVGDDRMCATCTELGTRGIVLLSTLPTVPGGDTECGARCRCVLTVWTAAEVEGGTAKLVRG